MFGIIDVNSMYCAFEQAFRPDLANRAGLKMGEPLLKAKPLIDKYNIQIFSSNYTLYNSMSSRFVSVVESLSAQCEQYSMMGITTALELVRANTHFIRKNFSVVLEQTVRELRGEVCFALQEHPATKQQIIVSRSFGQRITSLDEMK